MYSTNSIRKRFDLTQKEISNIFGISTRTIENWDSRFCMPKYVYEMMSCTLRNLQKKYGDEQKLDYTFYNYCIRYYTEIYVCDQ